MRVGLPYPLIINHLNHTIMLRTEIIGNIGGDAEIKNDNGRQYVQFSVADTRRFTASDGTKQEVTNWVSCFYRNPEAEVVKYLKKGTRVYVRGNAELRLFSSAKDRKMKAGLSINVAEIELVGGTSEAVPRELATPTGELIYTYKAYYIDTRNYNETNPMPGVLYDRRGNPYSVTQNGFIIIPTDNSQETYESTETTNAAEDEQA